MNRSKIIITTDMIHLCPSHTASHHLLLYSLEAFFNVKMKFDIIALCTLYFHLHLYILDAFFNARMELKIYHLIILIIIMNDLSFFLFIFVLLKFVHYKLNVLIYSLAHLNKIKIKYKIKIIY